ncbi:MAG TPA: recombinase family protein [Candidatus Acidoferrales bacterium]|nr:recombinase family protein [Candidatus Acidoferrales bacterium]
MQGNIKGLIIIQYRRKSTEGDERQIASLPDQATAILSLREHLGIEPPQILDDVEEAKSAKEPGRIGFNTKLINQIAKGHANAIMCWHADRLSRNAIDTAALVNLMDVGRLQAIITNQQIFWNTPMDKFMLALLCGQAKLENDNKSINVKRGLQGKVRRGWRPGVAPIGYLNSKVKEKGERDIVIDEERFPLVRKLWDLFLSGKYSVRRIHRIAKDELRLRTRETRKKGGKPLSVSHIYKILTDPFYYGSYLWINSDTEKKELVKGSHRPMISEDEYRKAQMILGRPLKHQSHTHFFPYTGLIQCGECRAQVTAEEKWQVICGSCKEKFASENRDRCPSCDTRIPDMENKKLLHYVYYHCTKRKNPHCSQRSIHAEEIEEEVKQVLKAISIKKKFLEWATDDMKAETEEDTVPKQRSLSNVRKEISKLEEELAETNRFIIHQEASGWTIMAKEDAMAERSRIEEQLKELEEHASKEKLEASLDGAMDTLRFVYNANFWFREGAMAQKKAIAEVLGSNLTLKDKKLSINLRYPLPEIAHMIQIAPWISGEFEPKNYEEEKRAFDSFRAKIPLLRRSLNAVRTCPLSQLLPFSELVRSFSDKENQKTSRA